MGLFKKIVSDVSKSFNESLEDVKKEALKSLQGAKDEAWKNLQEAKDEVRKNIQEVKDETLEDFQKTKQEVLNDFQEAKQDLFSSEDGDEYDTRVVPGTVENGVLTIEEGYIGKGTLFEYENIRKVIFPSTLEKIDTDFFREHREQLEEVDFSKVTLLKVIPKYLFYMCKQLKEISFPEGVETIKEKVFGECESLRKITFPSTLKTLDSTTSGCKNLKKIDLSKSHQLDEIPDHFIFEDCQILRLIIPEGVKILGGEFAASASIKEIYIPKTVDEIWTTGDCGGADVYLYSDEITDIEGLCKHVSTLYVPGDLYAYYADLLRKIKNAKVQLRKMPADKLNFYGTYVSEEPIQKSPGNLFSDGLEELIDSVAQSDEITDDKKEVVLRRAVKEGEDPDEVEMELEARFFKAHNK